MFTASGLGKAAEHGTIDKNAGAQGLDALVRGSQAGVVAPTGDEAWGACHDLYLAARLLPAATLQVSHTKPAKRPARAALFLAHERQEVGTVRFG